MAKLFEARPVSDHIEIDAFSAAALKGDAIAIGALIGLSDYDTEAGKPGSLDIGKYAAVFQAAQSDLTGTAAIGESVYLNGGNLTTSAGGARVGVIVRLTGNATDGTFEFARL